MRERGRWKALLDRAQACLASFHSLFTEVEGERILIRPSEDAGLLNAYYRALVSMVTELALLSAAEDASSSRHQTLVVNDGRVAPDSIDYYNSFCDQLRGSVRAFLRNLILEALHDLPDFDRLAPEHLVDSDRVKNVILHARTVYVNPLDQLMSEYQGLQQKRAEMPERMRSLPAEVTGAPLQWDGENWASLSFLSFLKNEFRRFNTLEFVEGKLVLSRVRPIKPPHEFFGYPVTRSELAKYFNSFQGQTIMPPLLLDGPPGIGKTELILSYAQDRNIQIVVVGPDELNNRLALLLEKLGDLPKNSLLFFDDLDPENINWHTFRQCVGGTVMYPANVAIALVTNHVFPENVRSRGCYITVPRFDHAVCREIINGYVKSTGRYNERMTDRIAVSYLLTYRQDRLQEISPRSLITYLDGLVSERFSLLAGPSQRFTDEAFEETFAVDLAKRRALAELAAASTKLS